MSTQALSKEHVRDAWNSIATGFDNYVSPLTFTVGDQLVERLDLRPGTRVLDVAAGSGALAIPAARRGALTTAVDLAPTMIDRLTARAKAEKLANLEGRVMDGLSLDLPDDAFDVSFSLNGVSLFPDVGAGLAEMVRVTRPTGRVVVVAFGPMARTEFITFFMAAMRATVPGFVPPSPERPPLPFQFSAPDRLAGALLDAGLRDVQVETITWEMAFKSARHYWDSVTSSNPLAVQLTADLTLEQRDDVRRVLEGMMRERSGGEPGAVLRNELTVGTGSKPAQTDGSASDAREGR